MNYEKDSVVNKNKIDEELERHGQLFMEYAEAAAEAEKEMNEAKARCQYLRHRLSKKIRKYPKKYEVDHIPQSAREKAIKDIVETDKSIRKADKEYFEAIRSHSVLEKSLSAMGSYRKNSLDKLANMILAGYFSEPRLRLTGKDYKEVMRRKEKGERKKYRSKINK